MTTSTQMSEKELVVPMYSWWQMFLMSAFDVDVNPTKWMPSPDPEVRALNIFIPRYSLWQMFKMTVLQTDG